MPPKYIKHFPLSINSPLTLSDIFRWRFDDTFATLVEKKRVVDEHNSDYGMYCSLLTLQDDKLLPISPHSTETLPSIDVASEHDCVPASMWQRVSASRHRCHDLGTLSNIMFALFCDRSISLSILRNASSSRDFASTSTLFAPLL